PGGIGRLVGGVIVQHSLDGGGVASCVRLAQRLGTVGEQRETRTRRQGCRGMIGHGTTTFRWWPTCPLRSGRKMVDVQRYRMGIVPLPRTGGAPVRSVHNGIRESLTCQPTGAVVVAVRAKDCAV